MYLDHPFIPYIGASRRPTPKTFELTIVPTKKPEVVDRRPLPPTFIYNTVNNITVNVRKTTYKIVHYHYVKHNVTIIENIRKFTDIHEITDIDNFFNKISRYYIKNIFQLALSQLIAMHGNKRVNLQCTEDGALHVAQSQAALDSYEMLEGSGSDTFVEKTFSQQVSRLDIFVYDNAAIIKIARDTVASYGGEIEIWPDSFYSIDALVQRVSVKNKTTGSNARFKLVGWYTAG